MVKTSQVARAEQTICDRQRFDVAIVGSGPAAYAAAVAAADAGFSVILLRRRESRHSWGVGEHLSPNAKPLLDELGMAAVACADVHLESPGVLSCWGEPIAGCRDYLFNPFGYALNLDRREFDSMLMSTASDSGAFVLDITRIEELRRCNAHWQIFLSNFPSSRPVFARFLIDATGRAATVARMLGYRPKKFDKLVALHALVEQTINTNAHLLLEAAEDGWWYSVPLTRGRCVAVYMTDADHVPRETDACKAFWMSRLDSSPATRIRVRPTSSITEVRIAPACSQALTTVAGPDWLAIGDSAMAFDPLAAVGLEKALAGAIDARDTLLSLLRKGNWQPKTHNNASRKRVNDYLENRHRYYCLERRWPHSSFWQRRQIKDAQHHYDGTLCR